jgi:hypothetical protein
VERPACTNARVDWLEKIRSGANTAVALVEPEVFDGAYSNVVACNLGFESGASMVGLPLQALARTSCCGTCV